MVSRPQSCQWLAFLAVAVLIGTGIYILKSYLPGYIRERIIDALHERYESGVEITGLRISILPGIRVSGDALVLRHEGYPGKPPLIRVGKFSGDARLWELLLRPHELRDVKLQSLKITIPPRNEKPREAETTPHRHKHKVYRVVVDEIVVDNAELGILPDDPRRPPRIFTIHHLTLRHAGTGSAMRFDAELTNPEPTGEIRSHGSFGPWNIEDPGLTPLSATYTFTNADLATFRGISGILSSQGKFSGRLNNIVIDGTTTTSKFELSVSGHPVPLETQFHAIVDGTNGNTFLEPVRAQVFHSFFTARGGIFRKTGARPRTVILDVSASQDKLEDLIRLAIKSKTPPMIGLISYKARLVIPPGEADLVDRMKLRGSFNISKGFFLKLRVQEKVNTLSHRGLGQPQASDQGAAVSELRGRFALSDAIMTFSDLTFSVPGAAVRLSGNYNLHSEQLDFHGTLRLQAEVSQLTTGWKSILLRPVDPLFRKGRTGTVLPIKVVGTESSPSFSIEIRRALTRKDN